jgi:guanylate kinase
MPDMNDSVLYGQIVPFFHTLLADYRAGNVTANHAMQYAVALFLCGRSGAGKDTLRWHLLEHVSRLGRVVTTTTRPPEVRGGRQEVHGEDYFFVSPEQFDDMWQKGGLLERDTFACNHYGCSVEGILASLALGKVPILQITYEGVQVVRQKLDADGRARGIFISAPRSVVEERIRLRAKHTNAVVDESSLARRLDEGDEEEQRFRPHFISPFGVVVNNVQIETAQSEILAHAQLMVDALLTACHRKVLTAVG